MRTFLIAGAACVAVAAAVSVRSGAGDAPGVRLRARIFVFILAACWLTGGAYGSYELAWEDPLEKYAVSRYNNVEGEANAEADDAPENAGESPGDSSAAGAMPAQRGRVLKVREKDADYRSLTVRLGGRSVLLNVSGEGPAPEDVIGREIAFSGEVELPPGRRNPGVFDYALYLKTQGVRVIVRCDAGDVKVVSTSRSLPWDVYSVLCRLRYSFLDRVRTWMPQDEYELFAGMMFGGSSEMDEESYDLFRRNGVAHILSVSGLHVAIVYAFLNILFGRRRTLPVYACVAAALVCYAAMSEFSPSVVRAVTMIGLHLSSKILRMRYDLLTGTCAAAFAMLLANPLDLLSVGFRLSFLAVLLLAFAVPLAGRYYGYRDSRTGRALSGKDMETRADGGPMDAVKAKIVNVMLPVFVIQLGMAPVIAYEFNGVSLSGLVLNPPVIALAGWALPVGVCMLMLHAASLGLPAALSGNAVGGALDSLLRVGAGCEGTMASWIIGLTRLADAIPYGSFTVTSPPVQSLFVFYGFLFFMMSETRTLLFARRRFRRAALACAGVVLAAALTLASPVCRQDRSSLVFVDVGQGDCLHVRTPDGRNYLVDGGGDVDYNVGAKTLLPYLLKNGVGRLDGIFATHLHTDHWRGLCELSERMDVGKVYIYEGNIVREGEIVRGVGAEKGVAKESAETADAREDRFSENADKPALGVDRSAMRYIAQGDAVTLGEGVRLGVLYPPRRAEEEYLRAAEDEDAGRGDENANSLIMKIDYEGVTVLMTGDSGEEGERTLLDADAQALHSRILKVGHHGSKYSTTDDFLAAVAPDAAVIQVGRNTFGHPTAEVLDKLKRDDIMVFRNDLGGAILFAVRDGKVTDAEDCGTRFQDD
jgi:competence protein ComEC